MAKIQLKRSVILNGSNAQEPTASQMTFGEIAVNYNSNDPAIFIKDSTDSIIRIAGVNAKGNTPSDIQGYPDITDGEGATLDNRYLKVGASAGAQVIQSTSTTDFNGGLKVSGGSTHLLELAHSGSTKLAVLANGNVGIGTGSPTTLFDVNGSVNFAGSATLSGITSDSTIYVNRTGSTQTAFQASLSGTTKVDITAGGSATFNGVVESNGSYFRSRRTSGTQVVFQGQVDSTANVVIKADGSAMFYGNVGIGTNSPGTNLDIAPASSSATLRVHARSNSSAVSAIELVRGTSTTFGGDNFGDYRLKDSSGELVVEYGHQGTTSERFRIDSSGNVGIGTTSPQQPLHISNALPVIRLQDTTTNAYSEITSDNAGNVYISADTGNSQADTSIRLLVDADEKARLDSGGRLLVGTSSWSSAIGMVVASSAGDSIGRVFIGKKDSSIVSGNGIGTIQFGGSNDETIGADIKGEADATWTHGSYHPSRLVFSTTSGVASSPTERMVIDSSGNVGIGTTSPQTITHVIGANPIFRIQDNSTAIADAFAGIQLAESSSGESLGNYWQIALEGDSGTSTDHLTFKDGTGERMRIDSSGNITVAGGVGTTDGISLQSNGVIKARGDSLSTTNAGLAIYRSGSSSSNIVARINYDGSAQFGSYVISGQNPAGGVNNGAMLSNDGAFQVSRGANSNIWAGYTTGTSTATSLITSDGSATFDSKIDVGGGYTTTNGVTIQPSILRVRDDSNQATNAGLAIYRGGATSSNIVARINYNGNASFAGAITGADWDSSGGTGTGYFLGATGGLYVRRAATADNTDTLFAGFKGDGNPVALITANGNATFAGSVFSGADPANGANNGAEVNPAGVFLASRPSSNIIWYGYTTGTSTATSTIKADGSATFDGDVQSGGDANGGAEDGVRLRSSGIVQAARSSSTNNIWTGYLTGTAGTTPTSKITAGGIAQFNTRVNIGTPTEGHADADELTLASTGNTGMTIRSGTSNSGVIYFSDAITGTAEYAGYIHYNHGDSSLRIGKATGEEMRIDSSGNVGIGTTTPGRTLHIDSGSTAASYIRFTNDNSTSTGCEVGLYDNGTDASTLVIKNSMTDGVVSITAGGSQRALIDSSGRVGINITPSGDSKLQINGSMRFAGSGTVTDSTSPIIYRVSGADHLAFASGNSERMRIDSSGKVGIGTSNPLTRIHLAETGASDEPTLLIESENSKIYLRTAGSSGSFPTGGGPNDGELVYVGGDFRVGAQAADKSLIFFSGGYDERMRIDSLGRLLINTPTAFATSTADFLQIQGATSNKNPGISLMRSGTTVVNTNHLGDIEFWSNDGGTATHCASMFGQATQAHTASDRGSSLRFKVTKDDTNTPFEAMEIDDDGRLRVFGAVSMAAQFRTISTLASSTAIGLVKGASAVSTGGTTCFAIKCDGDVENTNNNYGAISDVKLKENIVDAGSQWADLKALRVRKFNFKEETGNGTDTHIGLIAQEVELVSPGLVKDTPDIEEYQDPVLDSEGNPVLDDDGNPIVDTKERETGEVTKTVGYSVLYMKAVKALQEAMERIETLETKVAALEAG